MLDESSQAAALRRPEAGTPRTVSQSVHERTELVGDEILLWIGQQSVGASVLCGTLLRVQLRTYKTTGHIMSYSDEYVLRKIRNHARLGTLPSIHVRCMRCGCRALLLDWFAAADIYEDPLMAGRRFGSAGHDLVDHDFYKECAGDNKVEDALILLD